MKVCLGRRAGRDITAPERAGDGATGLRRIVSTSRDVLNNFQESDHSTYDVGFVEIASMTAVDQHGLEIEIVLDAPKGVVGDVALVA
jgi:hypothetical protein